MNLRSYHLPEQSDCASPRFPPEARNVIRRLPDAVRRANPIKNTEANIQYRLSENAKFIKTNQCKAIPIGNDHATDVYQRKFR